MANWSFEVLPTKTASDKLLHDKTFNVVENPKHDGD